MTYRHGMPIWYELTSADPQASRAFYDHVIGWTTEAEPSGDMDYRMIATGDGNVGGVMRLTEAMAADGAKPGWLFYIGVEDVDASAAAIKAAGGAVLMGPWTVPGVGPMAVVADPQGNPFYIMHGDSEAGDVSRAFDRAGLGKCGWNELITSHQAAGNAFYATVFGWTYPGKMEMPGDMGDYVFVNVGDIQIGATMQAAWDAESAATASGWRFYFRAPDIEQAATKVREGGGSVLMGPHPVPTGERIIVATDPHGVVFCVVAAAEQA